MSNVSKRKKDGSRGKIKTLGDHREFLKRITKTLYYGELPTLPCLSLPVTEVSCSLWSAAQRGRSLRRLHADAAAALARSACVSPCALVLAILYLERLKRCNPDYLAAASPADLFLVTLMVSNKFLQDDGEDDEVMCSEWATSGGLDLDQLKKLEVEFLNAIDWKVFVSQESFEAGLSWLEQQVALRQAQLRGFFTYSDLACCDSTLAASLLRELAGSCADMALAPFSQIANYVHLCKAANLAHIANFAALVATLLLSQACLPALFSSPSPGLSAPNTSLSERAPRTHVTNTNFSSPDTQNRTHSLNLDNLKCCDRWARCNGETYSKRNWYDLTTSQVDTWWSNSVLNWAYQSTTINPIQRWLEKIDQYADLLKSGASTHFHGAQAGKKHCLRGWLNLSRICLYVTSVSDR